MRKFSSAFSILIALAAATSWAQAPAAKSPQNNVKLPAGVSPGEVRPMPQTRAFEASLQEAQDAKAAVRRMAEARSDQRQRRLAACRWYGLSNLRPQASTDPVDSDYAPHWASNNGFFPYRWNGGGEVWVVETPDRVRAY
ncbi:MAG: hypothetical protein ABSG68_09285 [Thermoguttaceae bacterium]|jgi:hypothetical protein